MRPLDELKCMACEGGADKMEERDVLDAMESLPKWSNVGDKMIEKTFKFPDFKQALGFTQDIGKISEEEDHHPEITLAWGKVHVKLWTHSVGGVTMNDLICAAKYEDAYERF